MTTSESRFLFITILLAVLLGFPTFYSVFEPELSPKEVKAVLQSRADENLTGSRSPASIKQPNFATLLSKDIFCENVKSKFRTKNDFIQLSGRTCLKKVSQKIMNVVNKTNGYTASYFALDGEKYQTDLIRLQGGKNVIEFEVVGPGDQREINVLEIMAELSMPVDPSL